MFSRRKSDWLTPVDICWWLGSNVTMRGTFFLVTGLGGGSSRVSLSRDAALDYDSKRSFMGYSRVTKWEIIILVKW